MDFAARLSLKSKLYLSFGALIMVLIGASLGLDQWSKATARDGLERTEEADAVEAGALEIKLHMMTMSDAMRGYMLDPAAEAEMKRKVAADDALVAAVERMKERVGDEPALVSAIDAIGDYDEKALNPVEQKLMGIIKTDPDAARAGYVRDYLPLRQKQEKLVGDLDRAISALKARIRDEMNAATGRQQTIAFALYGLMLVTAGLLGHVLSRSVSRPIEQMTGTMS
jgi:hypothetical protein